jgi:DNA-directed RNA polymerase specialized sigma24 family protein
VRHRFAQKRGGQFEITALETNVAERLHDADGLQDVSDALDELAEFEPALAEVVDLKFFCGFSFPEIAAMRGVSERTVQRQWEKARLFLHRTLSDEAKPS